MRISPNRSSGIHDLNFYNNFCGVWVSKKASRLRCSWLAEKSHARFSVNYKICIMNGSFHPVLSGFSLYNTKCKVRKWFQPEVPWLNDHLGAVKLLDSEDGFRTGCRNTSRQQHSFLGLQSPRSLLSIKVHQNCCIVAMYQSSKIIYAFVVENRITYLLI